MSNWQYWLGWIGFWAVAFALVIIAARLFLINPLLNRFDALLIMLMRLQIAMDQDNGHQH